VRVLREMFDMIKNDVELKRAFVSLVNELITALRDDCDFIDMLLLQRKYERSLTKYLHNDHGPVVPE
jgi:hypothetical protein